MSIFDKFDDYALVKLARKEQQKILDAGRSYCIVREDGCMVERGLVDGKLVDTMLMNAQACAASANELFQDMEQLVRESIVTT